MSKEVRSSTELTPFSGVLVDEAMERELTRARAMARLLWTPPTPTLIVIKFFVGETEDISSIELRVVSLRLNDPPDVDEVFEIRRDLLFDRCSTSQTSQSSSSLSMLFASSSTYS